MPCAASHPVGAEPSPKPTQALLVYEVTWAWLNEHFGFLTDDASGTQAFMERRCH
jgi:hypothetical protein